MQGVEQKMQEIVKSQGNDLKNIRIKRCLNFEQACNICGVSRSTLWNIEKGGTVRLLTANKIAKGYNIEFDNYFIAL